MTPALNYLIASLFLGLLQVVGTAMCKRSQEPWLWAVGARDEGQPTYTGVVARLTRAQSNLFETLPLFAAAVLVAHVSGHDGSLATWGAALYFWGRLVFVPLYAFGVGTFRTVAWSVATFGLCLELSASLIPA